MKFMTKNIEALDQYDYEICKKRFNSQKAAVRYSTRHMSSRKGKREKACIKAALRNVPPNSLILDLPCGTGRLSFFLKELGFRVIGADVSFYMVEHAKQFLTTNNVHFEQQDILAIKHPDHTFQAAVCNRLFHHYANLEIRRLALKELMRVTDGPIIVSFFNSFSLSACWSKFKNWLKNKTPADRLPISFYTFKRDIEACGLKIENAYYCQYGISPQTYLKLVRK
jgi:ubiquinone/menaquinone biosynthesis C-methylase UbiE